MQKIQQFIWQVNLNLLSGGTFCAIEINMIEKYIIMNFEEFGLVLYAQT